MAGRLGPGNLPQNCTAAATRQVRSALDLSGAGDGGYVRASRTIWRATDDSDDHYDYAIAL